MLENIPAVSTPYNWHDLWFLLSVWFDINYFLFEKIIFPAREWSFLPPLFSSYHYSTRFISLYDKAGRRDEEPYTITYDKAWQAKQKALEKRFGTFEDSYHNLPPLLKLLKTRNPGTYTAIDDFVNPDGKRILRRAFWSFGCMIEEFKHCRPILCVRGWNILDWEVQRSDPNSNRGWCGEPCCAYCLCLHRIWEHRQLAMVSEACEDWCCRRHL